MMMVLDVQNECWYFLASHFSIALRSIGSIIERNRFVLNYVQTSMMRNSMMLETTKL